MSTRTRVAVIGGGRSGNHDASLASAASATQALKGAGRWDVVPLTVGRDSSWLDAHGHPLDTAAAITILRGCDVALPLAPAMAGFLELTGVRYAGSGVGAGAIGTDRWATKLVAEAIGIATAPGTLLTARTAADFRWSEPVVVKPVGTGSSPGVSLVDTRAGLEPALREALRHDDRVLVERVILGREIGVGVLGRPDGSRTVAPPLEVVAAGLLDYSSRHDRPAEFRIPAEIDDVCRKSLEIAAVGIYDALGCRGVTRADFFLTEDGLMLNKVNTVPGLTARSRTPWMFAAAGITYSELLTILIDDALARPSR